ncbi:MAG: alpha-glucosidase/alpha-galactosidase [Clostridia bacterium]|nr:alpha-glucosidase/alpha-galactosidase [Clostridia bacterium]
MYYENKCAKDVKIGYIGGGSRGWAWGFMSDLISAPDMSGTVCLYDIDKVAAEKNRIIGEQYNQAEGAKSEWHYTVADTLEDALSGADFVVISILPGTFDEMESDVHTPEKYGIYQSVGDTTGPGGIIRALRTIPMFEVIAKAVEKCCPNAWVINYTNPMTLCVKTLYRTFPKIKAFGCCHEVFGTQRLLSIALNDYYNTDVYARDDIRTNVIGVNHFTWITDASCNNHDVFGVYDSFCDKYAETGYSTKKNWANKAFMEYQLVKMDLFKRFGYIAAAGDRHLAEFCPSSWYLKDPQTVDSWKYALTSVEWRRQNLKERLGKSEAMLSGEMPITIKRTGEDGVNQMRALLGLENMITNVNIPNQGQIPNLPLGAVVETNATFRANEVMPVYAGNIPNELYSLISRIVGIQETVSDGATERDLDKVFLAFIEDPQMNIPVKDAKTLFDEMVANTAKYLTEYL